MDREKIINIFKDLNIEVEDINNASNSFNSNVYIVKSIDKKKYVLKFCNNEKKMINESMYMKYLKDYLPVADVIGTGFLEDKNYIVQSFLEGDNLYDEVANELSDEQVRNIGILLGKLHSCPLLIVKSDSWIEYLNGCLDKTSDTLEEIFGEDDNKIISNYLREYIDNDIIGNYNDSILHMDFRIGNLMFCKNGDIGLIDLESMKNGEYVFDFVKMNRLFNKEKFKVLLDGYSSVKKLDSNFLDRLDFYSLFDSYTSLWWCVSKNQTDSDFYKLNYEIVVKYLNKIKDL